MSILTVENITKHFGGLVAVRNLSLSVEPAEILGMIGPNGAGKTTAFNMISGYYRPDGGRIIFDGQDVTGHRPDQICKRGLARTFQVVKPFPHLTVLENVIVGAYNRTSDKKVARRKAQEVIDFLGMADMAQQLAGSLPVASRKRLEIAKALATGPKMILLDEAMAGLRPAETDQIIELVRQVSNEGIAMLLVEHVMRVIMSLAHRIIVLHHGEVIAQGEPSAVVRDQAVIDAYLGGEAVDVAG